jgi:hypothetical protein
MDRRSRHRIAKCEDLFSAAQQKRDERLQQTLQVAPLHARRHATAVAAMVLAGNPKIDERLHLAWARALQHFGIDNKDQVTASRELRRIIIGDGKESARFTEIFSTAPALVTAFHSNSFGCSFIEIPITGHVRYVRMGQCWVRRCTTLAQAPDRHHDGGRSHS